MIGFFFWGCRWFSRSQKQRLIPHLCHKAHIHSAFRIDPHDIQPLDVLGKRLEVIGCVGSPDPEEILIFLILVNDPPA